MNAVEIKDMMKCYVTNIYIMFTNIQLVLTFNRIKENILLWL